MLRGDATFYSHPISLTFMPASQPASHPSIHPSLSLDRLFAAVWHQSGALGAVAQVVSKCCMFNINQVTRAWTLPTVLWTETSHVVSLPSVREFGWPPSSNQKRSPNLSLLNWSPTRHWKVGPRRPSSAGRSMRPPRKRSMSDISL